MRLLAPIAVAGLAVALAGCGHKGAATTATTAPTTSAPAGVTHAAPGLEALLPAKISGTKLEKGSTTGAVVFGGDAFSKQLKKFLASVGKQPADLRFANAQDPAGKLEAEVGVFEVDGVPGTQLAQAIVESSRPNAPGLTATPGTLGGKQVIKVVYPGTSVLYLYPSGERVFYVGAQSEQLATGILGALNEG